jgi:hypothetical protein
VYEGPSWSWISCLHKVAIDGGGELHEHAELLDCSVTLKTDTAPFSQVLRGKLVIRADCMDMNAAKLREEYERWLPMLFWDNRQGFRRQDMDGCLRYAYIDINRANFHLALVLKPAGNSTFRRIGLLIIPGAWSLAERIVSVEDRDYHIR